jgi:hydrogenase 3 maturation protease
MKSQCMTTERSVSVEQLQQALAGKVCLLAVGNRMRGDDGAGPRVLDHLGEGVEAVCMDAGVAPENYLEKVVRAEPDTIVIIDTADFGGAAGETRLFDPAVVVQQGLSTHVGSLRLVAEYLATRTSARLCLLAIQPARTVPSEGMSRDVEEAVRALAGVLSRLLPGPA